MTQVRRPDALVVSYSYDALGRRVQRATSGGTWTRNTYDGADVVLDRNSDGSTVEYGNGLGIDDHLWQRTGGTARYFVANHFSDS